MNHHHAITVAAPRNLAPPHSGRSAPWLLQRDDDDFIAAVMAELGSVPGRQKLQASRAAERDGLQQLKLFQPVQRRFHVALIEAWCETAGQPRIDPQRVDAAGLVLRRVRDRNGTRVLEGWMRADGVVRGWLPIEQLGDECADPTPAVRMASRDTGVVQIDRALRRLAGNDPNTALQEDVSPMFLAPPEVCSRAAQTLYYGVVATASSELAQAAPDLAEAFAGFEADSDAFRAHLVQPLKGMAFNFPAPPLVGRRFDQSWLAQLLKARVDTDEHRFLQLLRQVAVEFDAFGGSPSASAVLSELAQVRLRYALRNGEGEASRRTIDAAEFLRAATLLLLDGESGLLELPEAWPELSVAHRQRLHQAMSGAMRARFASVKGRSGRFDEPGARYVLRAFVRLKPEGNCPARTSWSDYTEPFVIAPWYEGAGDPVQVALPDLSNRAVLRALKPNVSFLVPPSLQGLLAGDPEKLGKGQGQLDPSLTLGWICSFSIPVITLCAFIVLNIFLGLFDLIFRWMMFIKICIPFPKLKPGGEP